MLTPDMKIVPGHGKVSALREYDAYVAAVKETVGRIEKGIAEGKSAEQLKKANVLKGYESWATEFVTLDRYIDIIHRGLTQSR
jgi:hypothetical protein